MVALELHFVKPTHEFGSLIVRYKMLLQFVFVLRWHYEPFTTVVPAYFFALANDVNNLLAR
jgi:hypothetical protein